MRVAAILPLLVTLVATSAFAYDPYPFQRSDGKWGYVDDDHCWVIAPEYQMVEPFYNGLAPVMTSGKWGFILPDGTLSISTVFDGYKGYGWSQFIFTDGLNGVRIGDRYGFINISGELVIPAQFTDVGGFSNGLAPFSINGKWGYVGTDGKVAIPPMYDAAFEFIDGRAIVGKNELNSWETSYHTIDVRNREVTPSGTWGDAITYEGLRWIFLNGKVGFEDVEGNLLIAPNFDEASQFEEGVAAVKSGARWGYIDHSGSFVIPPKFDAASIFRGGRAKVKFGDQEFIINRAGDILLDPTCDHTR